MSRFRRLGQLRNLPLPSTKRYIKVMRPNYREEVKEIYRIAAVDYYASLIEKGLSKENVQREMEKFQRKMASQQKAMLESLEKGDKDVPTAKSEDN